MTYYCRKCGKFIGKKTSKSESYSGKSIVNDLVKNEIIVKCECGEVNIIKRKSD